jgi:hypothetical protein
MIPFLDLTNCPFILNDDVHFRYPYRPICIIDHDGEVHEPIEFDLKILKRLYPFKQSFLDLEFHANS